MFPEGGNSAGVWGRKAYPDTASKCSKTASRSKFLLGTRASPVLLLILQGVKTPFTEPLPLDVESHFAIRNQESRLTDCAGGKLELEGNRCQHQVKRAAQARRRSARCFGCPSQPKQDMHFQAYSVSVVLPCGHLISKTDNL